MSEKLESTSVWKEYMFICLWEADNPSDIEATLGPDMLAMITCDPMEVDEIDWAQVASL